LVVYVTAKFRRHFMPPNLCGFTQPATCGIGDDLVEPVLLAEVCQREAVCPHLHQCPLRSRATATE
jgi:hypothetical protein